MASDIKVIDVKQSDNDYLHKDFHGALCYAIQYLDDTFGQQATHDYLVQVGRTYFKPLSDKLKTDGLKALEDYWQKIFQKENGRFTLRYEDNRLVLEVQECPAISHLKKNNLLFTDRYCQTTVVVNETICGQAGYQCSCRYEPGQGKCIQIFWK